MSSFFENLLSGAAGYYNQDKASQAALELGERGAQEAARLGTETATMAEFKPFTVRTGLGTATTTPEGGFGLALDPRQQAIQDTAFGSAYGFMSGIGQDPMSQLLGGQALQAYQGLGPSALTGMGVSGYQNVGQDPMQREILAQARERFQDIGTDPRQQELLSRADTAFGQAFGDSSQAQADIYSQLRAAQQPEEERERLALEERMLAQGRLGVSSSAYGGSSPELLAQAKALEEARASASLTARQQANKEQQQAYERGLGLLGEASGMRAQELEEATGLLGAGYTPEQRELARAQAQFGAGMTQDKFDLMKASGLLEASYIPRTQDLAMAQSLFDIGYTPQQQMLEALGLGTKTAGLSDIGRRTGAELFGQLGQTGLETLMQGAELAQGLEASKRQSLTEALLGRQPSMQEQLLANYLKVPVPQGGGGMLSEGIDWLTGLLSGDNDKTKSQERFGEEMIDEPVAGMYDFI